MIKKNQMLRIIKFIDYIYINSYVINSLISKQDTSGDMNDWKIFSARSNKCNNEDNFNILYLIQLLSSQNQFDYEVFLISIHIYKKICKYNAHLIDNYTYLFGSVYISTNKIFCDEFLQNDFLSNVFGIDKITIQKMVNCIDKFIDCNNIYFGTEERTKIINEINYS